MSLYQGSREPRTISCCSDTPALPSLWLRVGLLPAADSAQAKAAEPPAPAAAAAVCSQSPGPQSCKSPPFRDGKASRKRNTRSNSHPQTTPESSGGLRCTNSRRISTAFCLSLPRLGSFPELSLQQGNGFEK